METVSEFIFLCIDSEIVEGVIRSTHKMTYTEVTKILDGDQETIQKYTDVADMVCLFAELTKILQAMRSKKGSVTLDVKEAKMIDLIYSGRRVDFGATYMGFDAPGWLLQNMLARNDYNVQGAYLGNKPMYENLIEKIYASFGLEFPGLP